ncbi:MAG: phage tail tape measure protein [Treponema sp.]|nr:phage tail tape measure protein [Treponema sp.]
MAEDMAIAYDITADAKGFKAEIQSCQQSLSGFGKTLDKAFNKVNDGIKGWGLNLNSLYDKGSSIFKSFGVDIDQFASHFGVSGKVMAGITAATVALTKFGQEMHGAMSEIAKGTGATGEQLLALQENVKDAMVQGVGRPIAEIGTMVADLNTRFGSTGEQLVQLTSQFDDFGEVTGTGVHDAINGVADVISKWGMSVEDVNPLLDQLTKAGQDSGASVASLLQNLKQSRTVFSQFGMSATRSIAFLETLAKAGIDTGTAMQGMKIALANFAAQGRNAQEAFKEVGDAIRDASSDSEALNIAIETFGARAGPEMINVFRNGTASVEEFEKALIEAGGALEETDKASRTSKDAMAELINALKGTFAGFGEGFDTLVRDILDSLRNLVLMMDPVIRPIGNIFRDVFETIGSVLKTVIGAFVEFQQEYNKIFQQVVQVISNVYETLHKILKNIQDIFIDVFGFIFALLDKNWTLAWEYAKNALFKFLDIILDALTQFIKALAPLINKAVDGINKIIEAYNWVQKKLGNETAKLLDGIGEDFNLSDKLGITKLVEESDRKIAELTGKTQKKLVGVLGEVKDVSSDIIGATEEGAKGVADAISQWDAKILQQQIERLNREKQNAVVRAQNEEASEAEILAIKESYDYKIRALQEAQLNREKKAALAKAASAEEAAKIELYYSNEIAKLYEKTEERIQKAKEAQSQWDSKLLAQKISMLEQEEKLTVEAAEKEKKSEEEMYQIRSEYGKRIIELKKKQFEEQRKADLEGVTNAEEIYKINTYYNNEITSMIAEENRKRVADTKMTNGEEVKSEESKFKAVTTIIKKFIGTVKKVFGSITKVVSSVFKAVKTAVTKIFSSMTSAFKLVKGGFQKLFELDTTESLTSLLEYEDKILTFFTFTLQKIPGYVDSAVSSVSVLMGKLFEQIDFGRLGEMIGDIIKTLTTQGPRIVNQIATLFTGIAKSVGAAIIENSAAIAEALGSMFMSVLDNMPVMMSTLATVVLTAVKNIGAYINANAEKIGQDLSDLIGGIARSLADFVSNGGWKVLLDAVLNIIKAVNKALVDNLPTIVDTIIAMLPDLVDTIVAAIVDINKALCKMAKPLAKLVVALIKAIIDLAFNEDVIKTAIDVFIAFLEAVVTEIIPQLPSLIIKLVTAAIGAFVKAVPQLVTGIIKGLIGGFAKTNWGKVVKDIFMAFINGIKNLFGIHSPSTLFAEFGGFMVQGLVKGLSNIWGSVSGIFTNLSGNIHSAISAVTDTVRNWGSNITNMVSGVFDKIKSFASNITNTMKDAFNNVSSFGSNIAGHVSNAFESVKNGVSSGFDKVKSWLGFATGTNAAPSGLALVGEKGPELIDFHGGERVYNADNTRKLLSSGGGGNSFHITFNNTSQTTAYTVMQQMRKFSRQMAFNGVL